MYSGDMRGICTVKLTALRSRVSIDLEKTMCLGWCKPPSRLQYLRRRARPPARPIGPTRSVWSVARNEIDGETVKCS